MTRGNKGYTWQVSLRAAERWMECFAITIINEILGVKPMEKTPRKTFWAGPVRASVWNNEVVLPNGEKTTMPKVCIERRYRDGQGQWQGSSHFGINELAKLLSVARAAFDYLVLSSRDNSEEIPVKVQDAQSTTQGGR